MIPEISHAIEQTIEQLFEQFHRDPFKFYTESDLVCEFYRLFLSNYPASLVLDASGRSHSIIHTEYPTPFRCDMSDLQFILKKDDDKKEGRGKFKRGHLDLVILNLEMIKELKAEEVMMQNYAATKESVTSKIRPGNPMVLHAMEFQYARGKLTKEGAQRFVDVIKQDHDKLAACCHPGSADGCEGFVETYESLVFLQSDSQRCYFEEQIMGIDGIKLCFPATPI